MAQQTAVEWLLSKLKEYVNPVASDRNSYSIRIPKSDMVNAIQQSKAMEKEQIIGAFLNGDDLSHLSPKMMVEEAEQYYNETYNK